VPGSVPIYESASDAMRAGGERRARDEMLLPSSHAMDGVDFVTVHCGVTF
jgi:thiamine biosynthesis protein ThiC